MRNRVRARSIVVASVLGAFLTIPLGAQVARPAWFDESYWQQLVFNRLENSNWQGNWSTVVERERAINMNFHISTSVPAGEPPLQERWVNRYRELIPILMRRFTGLPWAGRITDGPEKVERPGWVSIVIDNRGCASGGSWYSSGAWVRGIIRLNTVGAASQPDHCLKTVTFAHELGHVLGFGHVDDVDDVMCTDTTARGGDCNGYIWDRMPAADDPAFTERLRMHAQLAYSIGGQFPYPGVAEAVPALPFLSNGIDRLFGTKKGAKE